LYIKITITGMILSIVCYVPPSVESLGLTTIVLKPGPTTPVFKPDWLHFKYISEMEEETGSVAIT